MDSKVLESLMIPDYEIANESLSDNSTCTITFLNKKFNVKISYGASYKEDGNTLGNPDVIKIQEVAIKKIIPMINRLSLGIKDKLIQMIKEDADAIDYELPDNFDPLDYFKPSIIQAESYYKKDIPKDRKVIIISKNYKLDPEHGAAIEFINERYSNMGQLDMFI